MVPGRLPWGGGIKVETSRRMSTWQVSRQAGKKMSVWAEGHLAFAKAWSLHLPGSELGRWRGCGKELRAEPRHAGLGGCLEDHQHLPS